MSKMRTFLSLLKTPQKLIAPLAHYGLLKWMSDEAYLKIMYRAYMGKELNLEKPVTFNEKLQWLKIHDNNPRYASLVDKIEAKKQIASIIGDQYIVPMYTYWQSTDEISFDDLPEQFVLKCSHDQGSVTIVENSRDIDIASVKKFYKSRLKINTFLDTREHPYENIKPRIFAEQFLGGRIKDYKFYCFNGTPLFLYVGQGLTIDHSLKIDFFDLDWNPMPFYRTDYHRLGMVEKPAHLDEMIEIAKKLSRNIPFVRIDLFEENDRVYFSEFTLYPGSGLMPFCPEKYDKIVGSWLKL